MYLKKTPNTHGRIRLSIVDNYYDRVKKCSRQKTIESIGFLDELQKIYEDPIAHFQKRVDQLNEEKRAKQAPILTYPVQRQNTHNMRLILLPLLLLAGPSQCPGFP